MHDHCESMQNLQGRHAFAVINAFDDFANDPRKHGTRFRSYETVYLQSLSRKRWAAPRLRFRVRNATSPTTGRVHANPYNIPGIARGVREAG